ncbi:major facilitator superfamily domain-containing protein [Polychytrium aggregatum]|uniref:major facilitator superfamily domain-containing protein n=1 Tax=Polychytrium aggregatum TaxID=110093 RepID=UPI0022FE4B0B|nr:major facilitator superfamily domain-containing protein [Polychytrium aggregatum]KAI9199400.1 major facilitator superfamily domain-containing protein [Polychytrium aggregatum]
MISNKRTFCFPSTLVDAGSLETCVDTRFDISCEKDHKKEQLAHLSPAQIVLLNSFWLGYHSFFFLLGAVISPYQIRNIMGEDHKGEGLSLVCFLSAAVTLPASLLVGALNDRYVSKYGKRKPWIVVGSLCMSSSLLLLSDKSSLTTYIGGYLLVTVGGVLASVPMNGLISDLSAPDQKGSVSAVMGTFNMVGYLAAAVVGIFSDTLGTRGMYIIMSSALMLSAGLTCQLNEPRNNYKAIHRERLVWSTLLADVLSPLQSFNFRMVFISRFFFQLGVATVQQFLQYWISDCVSSNMSPTKAVSVAVIPLLVISPVGAYFISASKRKTVVYISTALMSLTCLLMIVTTSFTGALVVSGVFGLGYGPFLSVEFALLMDVLPSGRDAARDISLWTVAMVLPQIVATPIAGWVRDEFQGLGSSWNLQCLGYKCIFAICVVYFALGAEFTRRIEGIH